MAEQKTAVQLIREYFTPPVPTMQEMKDLKPADRAELADLIAAEKGLKKTSPSAGSNVTTYS
jgi:hypothetical protein